MQRWRRDRRRSAALLIVVLLHAALLWRWATSPRAPREQPLAPAVVVRLLPRSEPVRSAVPEAPARRAAPAPRRAFSAPHEFRPPTAATAPPDPARPERLEAAAPAASAPPAEPAASAPPAEPAALDPDATARAIREVARAPGLAARAGRAGPAERAPEQRLGDGIAQGARGDCLKGEYLGAGMGLLSVPFLAAAVVRDACRR